MKTFRDYLAEAEPALTKKKFADSPAMNDIAVPKQNTFSMPTAGDQVAVPKAAPGGTTAAPKPAPGAGELDSDPLNRQQQITQQTLTPQQYQQKMDQVNQMRQQQGQEPLPVTPADQIATPPATGATPTPAAPATPAQPAAPKQWNTGVLGKGSKGPEVSALQKKLGIPDTGVYDAATITAVQTLQKKLGVAADGAYGPGTKAAHDKMAPTGSAALDGTKPGANPATTIPGGAGTAAGGAGIVPKQTQPQATAANPTAGAKGGATQAIPTTPVNPANPGGATSQMNMTPDQASAALGGSERDIAALGGRERLQQLAGIPKAAPAAPAPSGIKSLDPNQYQKGPAPATPAPQQFQIGPAPATPAPQQFQKAGTTTTRTNQSVSGTMKMGKPDGPITFNGKVVNPGEPEYAAASQALVAQQEKMQQYRQPGGLRSRATQLSPSAGAPISQGLASTDFEESLDKMLTIAGLR